MITRLLKLEERYWAVLTIAVAFEKSLDYKKGKETCLSLTQAEKDNILHPKSPQEQYINVEEGLQIFIHLIP